MVRRIVIVMDCGSTTTRVVAADDRGRLLAQAGARSGPGPQAGGDKGWVVWDLEALWKRLGRLSKQVCAKIKPSDIAAVTITTWGADGAPVDALGRLTYPPICWQCPRTTPTAEAITKEVSAWDLFRTTGYQVISFNTLLRLIWLRENAPKALDDATAWMMMAGLLSHKLCGEMTIDYTGASTMMALDLARRTWSPKLLKLAGVDASFFPRFVESGETIGAVTAKASRATGIPAGTPVTAAGHDTQFAPIGSGALSGEAILSSGTWEILMARVPQFKANRAGFDGGLIIEADALPGLFDPQLLMMGSGVLEWLAKHFYPDVNDTPKLYPTMIGDAAALAPGAGGVTLIPSFVAGTGPTKRYGTLGTILGLTISTQRGQVYRAALEGLSCQLQLAIEMLKAATGFSPKGIRVVGGGSKNDLWNQIRADVTGLPVTTIEQKEATVLGAAICALVGTGVYSSVEAAQKAMRFRETTFRPSRSAHAYETVYEDYKALLPNLRRHYRQGNP
ncbi:MAG TPA: FGGY family carbohydrate kinase [Planctomycetota bacterium]|nr:FGGY family carbohydrate kinase [Planctomycetota bacterium]